MITKTFPKYWVVDITENTEHKLLPKFKEWFIKESGSPYMWIHTYYGYEWNTDRFCNKNWYNREDSIGCFSNNPTLVTLEEWHDHFFPVTYTTSTTIVDDNWVRYPLNEKVAKPKATYTQYFKRSDWVVFSEDSINDESIESIKESRKADLASANRKQLLLNEHKKLFGNK